MRIVGIGGSMRAGSSTELLVRAVLAAAADGGATTTIITARALALPPYEPRPAQSARLRALLDAVRAADALVIGSPGYHGGVSGLVKNALDYFEELAHDERPYLDGLPVACVATASGWQAAAGTLRSLRDTVHALRGWPTPLGIAVNTASELLDDAGRFHDPRLTEQVHAIASQLIRFQTDRHTARDATSQADRADTARPLGRRAS